MRKQIVNPPNKKYNTSQDVSQKLKAVRKTTAARVELIGLLEDARHGRGELSLLDVADLYEQRGSVADKAKAKAIRKEATNEV